MHASWRCQTFPVLFAVLCCECVSVCVCVCARCTYVFLRLKFVYVHGPLLTPVGRVTSLQESIAKITAYSLRECFCLLRSTHELEVVLPEKFE